MPGFNPSVKMWVYPEKVDGQQLAHIINHRHENVKYLPGVKLAANLAAVEDLVACTKDADILLFVLPHQFVDAACSEMASHVKEGARGVSFIKGLFCSADYLELVSARISRLLKIPMCVFSGANVADEIAEGKFAEATLGFEKNSDLLFVKKLQSLFSLPTLRVTPIDDISGVEIAGALKNVVALAAGFVDGLGLGSNTKAAILRLGMIEIQNFGKEFLKGISCETFWQSSGFADIITTCYAGRNRRCAEAFAKTEENEWDGIERKMLCGQKLQGPSTCKEVYDFLNSKNRLSGYPLFHQIYKIAFGEDGQKAHPSTIVTCFQVDTLPDIVLCKL